MFIKYYGFSDEAGTGDGPFGAAINVLPDGWNAYDILPSSWRPSWSVLMVPISYAECAED